MRSSITTVPADRPDAAHSQFTFSSLQVFPVNFQVSIGTGLILTAKKRQPRSAKPRSIVHFRAGRLLVSVGEPVR
jgi:hypothetical protein